MTPQELARRLEAIPESDTDKIEALAAELLARARQPGTSAVVLWTSPGFGRLEERAMILLSALDEAALLPLLEDKSDLSAPQTAWLLRTAHADIMPLRSRLLARLDRALKDARPIPEPPRAIKPEDAPPARRVCDEAYLIARQFFNVEESRAQYLQNEKTFLKMPGDLKDKEIEKFRSSRSWTQLVEDIGM